MGNRRHGRKPKNKNGFKVPFIDNGRPGSPYTTDTLLVLQQHEALPPFGEGYKQLHRRGPEALQQMRKEQVPQSIYCMHNQPPGPEPPADAPKVQIEIVEEIRHCLMQGARVVGCKITKRSPVIEPYHDLLKGIDQDTVIVAKIFDPMYFYHNGRFDIIETADMEYCREVAAYKHLQKRGVDGVWLPKFYGSYSVELPLTEGQIEFLIQHKGANHPLLKPAVPVRRVRLILTEKIIAEPMTFQVTFGDVNGLTDDARLEAIASTFEAYARLYFLGVAQGDLAPRNVFVLDESELLYDEKGAVTAKSAEIYHFRRKNPQFFRFVDLGLAYVLGEEFSAVPCQDASDTRPLNPIKLFWNVFDSGAANMVYWFPPKMRNTPSCKRWLLRRWYGDTRFEAVGAVPAILSKEKPWHTRVRKNGKPIEDDQEQEPSASALREEEELLERQHQLGLRKQAGRQCAGIVNMAMAQLPGSLKGLAIGGKQQEPGPAPVVKNGQPGRTRGDLPSKADYWAGHDRGFDDKPQGFW